MTDATDPLEVRDLRARKRAHQLLAQRHSLEFASMLQYARGVEGLPPLKGAALEKYGIKASNRGCGVFGHDIACLCDVVVKP